MPKKQGYTSTRKNIRTRFPSGVMEWFGGPTTLREQVMVGFENDITDKREWERKVYDEVIVEKWRKEALSKEGFNFTEKTFEYVSD